MTLCFLSTRHLIRVFLGCIFSTELCCSKKSGQENTLLTDPSKEDSLLYFSLTTFIPYFKPLKRRAIFIKITFFFCNISFSSRLVIAACPPWAGKELCMGRDPLRHLTLPSVAGGGPAMPGPPRDHASLTLLLASCVTEGIPALVPALFVAHKLASAGPSHGAPLAVMS